MLARDIMTTNVVTVRPNVSVKQVAEIMVRRGISAVPVVATDGTLAGIVSEGDLMRRAETGTARPAPWWLAAFAGTDALAASFVKANARKVADVMTRDVITVNPDTPIGDIAALLERKRIKRVPVVESGRIVGIVSRANLVQALAAAAQGPHLEVTPSDASIRERLLQRLNREAWARTGLVNLVVSDGVVNLWGMVNSTQEKQATRVAAESTPGVVAVNDELIVRPRDALV